MAGSKRGIKAGRAYVEASLDDTLVQKGLRNLRTMFRGFSKSIAGLAAIGAGAALGGIAVGLHKISGALSETAQMAKTAKAFGLAADAASGLFGVFKASGSENARENIESLVTMSSRIGDAVSGKGAQAAELFKGLSVSAAELAALPLDEQFFRLHEAITQLPDPIDRVNRLMLAFGEDGGKTLIGTLSKSTPELRAQAAAFRITSEEAAAATEAQDALNAASASLERIWVKLAVALAPVIESLATHSTEIADQWDEMVARMEESWLSMGREVAASIAALQAQMLRMVAAALNAAATLASKLPLNRLGKFGMAAMGGLAGARAAAAGLNVKADNLSREAVAIEQARPIREGGAKAAEPIPVAVAEVPSDAATALGPQIEETVKRVTQGLNTAARVDSAEANRAIGQAAGWRGNDPTSVMKEVAKLNREQLKEQRQMRRQGVILAEGKAR